MKSKILIVTICFLQFFLMSCAESTKNNTTYEEELSTVQKQNLSQATFAGGCFWCVEAVFERVEGVESVVSGYAGGSEKKPTYKEVSSGTTSHAEAVTLYYDSTKVSYAKLLEVFFATHDPTTLNRQGPDVGAQYRSVVFFHNEHQETEVKQYLATLKKEKKFKDPIVTQLVPFEKFYEAEDYHQDYYEINPNESYTRAVTRPKVLKFEKDFPELLKSEYK